METFSIGLELRERVSQPGKRAADALRQVVQQAEKAQKKLDGKGWGDFGKQFEKVGLAEARAQKRRSDTMERTQKKQADAFAKMWEKVGLAAARAQEKAAKAQDRAIISRERAIQRRVEKMQEHSLMGGIKEGLGIGKLTQASFYGSMLAEGAFRIVDGMVEGARKAVEIITEGVKFAWEAGSKQQSLRLGERLSLGKGGDKEYQSDINRFSKLTGFGNAEIESMLLPLRRSGMNQQETRTALAAALDVAAGKGKGGDAGEVEKYLKAFESLRLRGGIEVEQLAGLGIDVHKYYSSIGKKLGVSEKTAKERMSEGKVNRNLLLNTLYENIEREQGGKLGTGAIMYSKTADARTRKLMALPEVYAAKISESSAFRRTSEILGRLLEQLDPDSPTGHRIMASLNSMFDRITGMVGDPGDAAEKLADHIENAIDFGRQLVEVAGELADAFLPSLETLEDMILAFREMKAAALGDDEAAMQVMRDRSRINQKRTDRIIEKQVRATTGDIFASKLKSNLLDEQLNSTISGFDGSVALNPLGLGVALWNAGSDTVQAQNDIRAAGGSTRQVNVTAPKIELQFYGPVDDDVARKVAPEIHREATSALEQAAAGSF